MNWYAWKKTCITNVTFKSSNSPLTLTTFKGQGENFKTLLWDNSVSQTGANFEGHFFMVSLNFRYTDYVKISRRQNRSWFSNIYNNFRMEFSISEHCGVSNLPVRSLVSQPPFTCWFSLASLERQDSILNQQPAKFCPRNHRRKTFLSEEKKTSIFKSYTYSTLWIRAFVEPTTKPPLRSSSLQVSYRARTIFNADTNCSSAHHIIIINITLPVRRWVLSTYL